ncbi:hypothetical protein HNY73_000962 [Argiope bruennichi]|uniref:Uncharacterized protein n=1 Tax=Argiope bruennichi TaxID=94029 RepID=A0A8T0G124_ARGBR|nr:hypothetical protein HNY73_000962 [Argiope bruennichi]
MKEVDITAFLRQRKVFVSLRSSSQPDGIAEKIGLQHDYGFKVPDTVAVQQMPGPIICASLRRWNQSSRNDKEQAKVISHFPAECSIER